MAFTARLLETAARAPKRIVMAEGEDDRVLDAAVKAAAAGVAELTLLGDREIVERGLAARRAEGAADVVDPRTDGRTEDYAKTYRSVRGSRISGLDEARAAIREPLGFAAMMVRQGDADGTIAGAASTTADTIRAALRIIGKAPGARLVSSFFLMKSEHSAGPLDDLVAFADCALVVAPDANDLADIAVNAARSARAFLHREPQVAMLSFSTLGSAEHPRAGLVRQATEIVRRECPELAVEGEIQFDAAINAAIRERKAPESRFQGAANVFVFPNLDAANIGYKIAERVGGMTAVGPILQGLAKPANDLSRGCSADDILSLIAITSVQASAAEFSAG